MSNVNTENGKKLAAIISDIDRWEQMKWSTHSMLADSGLGLVQTNANVGPPTVENYCQTLKQYVEIADQIVRNDFEMNLLNASIPVGQGIYANSQMTPGSNSLYSSPQRGTYYSASSDSGRPSGDNMISSSSMGSSSSGDNLNHHPNINHIASRTPVFGGSLEDHLNRVGLSSADRSTTPNQPQHMQTPGSVHSLTVGSSPAPPLPQVVVSCVCYLAKYGLRQQGVFRINGSQIEISDLKSKFERCENPLALIDNPSSVNASASVLKSYFRQLREPLLLPSCISFEQWVAVGNSSLGAVEAIRHLVAKMPSQIQTVAAFLFTFLHRVQEHCGENMMDAYNLAVCFAPCLLPTPSESDQMTHFNALAAIIKAMIINVNSIFKQEDLQLYDEVVNNKRKSVVEEENNRKSVSEKEPQNTPSMPSLARQPRALANVDHHVQSPMSVRSLIGSGSENTGGVTGDPNSNHLLDDCEAMFNFTARNSHEMTVKRGDRMRVTRRLNEQWWEVIMNGRLGLVPANYVRMLPASGRSSASLSLGLSNRHRSAIDGEGAGSSAGSKGNVLLMRHSSSTAAPGIKAHPIVAVTNSSSISNSLPSESAPTKTNPMINNENCASGNEKNPSLSTVVTSRPPLNNGSVSTNIEMHSKFIWYLYNIMLSIINNNFNLIRE